MTTPEQVLEHARQMIHEQREQLAALELQIIRALATHSAPAVSVAEKAQTVPGHYYISTSCQHFLHERCRVTCKFCEARCLCPCHRHGWDKT